MLKLTELNIPGYEKVIEARNEETGLHALFIIHSTQLGVALGGLRIKHYDNNKDALTDGLRLAKAMSQKAAVAEVTYGGGKSIIMLAKNQKKSPRLLSSYAEALNTLNGSYLTAYDLGSSLEDIKEIQKSSQYTANTSPSISNITAGVDISQFTAWGCFRGIQACAMQLWKSTCLKNKTVAIEGLGKVGWELANHLFWAGAKLIVTDIDKECLDRAEKKLGATIVSPKEFTSTQYDILSPCAIGKTINKETIPKLKCLAIAGAANNQLDTDADGTLLLERNIIYAPDYVINAGGIISLSELRKDENSGNIPTSCRNKTNLIYDRLIAIFQESQEKNIATNIITNQLAEQKIQGKH